MASKKIRITWTSQSLPKLVELLANGTLLASNAFLVGSSMRDQLRDRRRQRMVSGFQVASEIAAALAALAKVIGSTLEQHRAPAG